jgi:Fe-S oxidoreductase
LTDRIFRFCFSSLDKISLKVFSSLTITYHDSCYLGRYNQIYEPQREILKAVPGMTLKEMERSYDRSFCCGGGGGRMWMDEKIGTRVNRNRTAEALALNPDTIATACPFCLTMLDDGVKDANKEETVKVLDLAELLARAL